MDEKLYKTRYPGYKITKSGRVFNDQNYELTLRDRKNYMAIGISLPGGKKKNMYVQRLVAETFLPIPEGCDCVYHIDKNYKNNHVDNLRWIPASKLHTIAKPRGVKSVNQYDLDMNLIKTFDSVKDASKSLNIDKKSIYASCRKKNNTANGFVLRYTGDNSPEREYKNDKKVYTSIVCMGRPITMFAAGYCYKEIGKRDIQVEVPP